MSEKVKKHILFTGPPGSGKGTQAPVVAKAIGIPHISVGDIFRYHKQNSTSLGKRVSSYIDNGMLVPDDLTSELVFDTLESESCKNGEILDGFPRTLKQAKLLDEYLERKSESLYKIVYLNTPEKLIIKRLSGRRICKKCNRVYHIEYNPPKKEGVCDIDGDVLYQRKDDEEATIKKRLDTYKKMTFPIIEHYRKKGLVAEVDGSREIETVSADIIKLLK